jgi:hypothetical protein
MSFVDSATTKRCRECGIVKPVDDFSPEPRNRDGRQGRCKACRNVLREQWVRPEGYVEPVEKACSRCGEVKPIGEFTVNHSYLLGGREARCRSCLNGQRREYRARPETKALVRNWETRSKLKMRYGISHDEYLRLLGEQGGRCAICGGLPEGGPKSSRLHVDHDHDTGRVRGLICLKCNSALAQFGDSLEGVMKAVEYLKRSIEVTS